MSTAKLYLPVRLVLLAIGCALVPASAPAGIESTVHNLAVGGPGTVRATDVTSVCIFCHTPHNANPSRALWNRFLPAATYRPYTSSTLKADVDQPTGSSRLCLSCHDGTLALGTLHKPERGVQSSLGVLTGETVLGTDLADDHPISFVYDLALAVQASELLDPALLPNAVKLDENEQLQCTSCHDAHDDSFADFLVLDPRFGDICLACHRPRGWGSSSHATSAATWTGSGLPPWPDSPRFETVAENSCLNCHHSHSAPHPERLLSAPRDEDVCLVCHDGSAAQVDVSHDFRKFSAHPILSAFSGTHEPGENPLTMERHVVCQDCHDPHEAQSFPAVPPGIPGAMEGASGVTVSGAATPRATFGYEVCFKCHGVTEAPNPIVTRADNITNVRLEMAADNLSYHPVVTVGPNPTMTGFEPGYSAGSIIECGDCHGSESSERVGGLGANGVHGSLFEPILAREYQLAASGQVQESFSAYRLCYQCHNRSQVLSESQPFPHDKHVREEDTSCAACHDAHGSRNNRALINFMLFDTSGQPVVTANPAGLLEFQDLGPGSGLCYLSCHGEDHDPEGYGAVGESMASSLRRSTRGPLDLLRRVGPR